MKNHHQNKTNEELIKEAIERLHKTENSDYQTLMRQVQKYHKTHRVVTYNTPQLISMTMKMRLKKYKMHLDRWGRGTGKTTVIGAEINECLYQFPRGSGQFISPNYKMFLTRIIPSLRDGLEMFGLYENLHYFIGRKPPRNWKGFEKAYKAPSDYTHYVPFFNGFGINLISQDVVGDGRGLRTDVEFADEVGHIDWDLRNENNGPALLLGSKAGVFTEKPYFQKLFYHGSMPLTSQGDYIFQLERKNAETPTCFIVDATSRENEFIPDADAYLAAEHSRSVNEVVFNAEYLNIPPPKNGANGFYPLFSENKFGYRAADNREIANADNCLGDGDLVHGVPLLLGLDFGSAINFLVVAQHLRSINELRFINEFFGLSQNAEIQDDVIAAFFKYYEPHFSSNKDVYLFYDRHGNVETGHTRETRAQQAAAQLRRLGCNVRLFTQGKKNEDHNPKFKLWEDIMRNSKFEVVNPLLPIFSINLIRCKTLIISIYNSKAKELGNKMFKDKSVERKFLERGMRQFATDGSDAMDTIAVGLWGESQRYASAGGLRDVSIR